MGQPLFYRLILVIAMVSCSCCQWFSVASAYQPDPEFLQIKGYSPEIIDVTVTQSYRQEWRYPPPPQRTPTQQLWRNFVVNDWMGNIDPFGSYRIRERQ